MLAVNEAIADSYVALIGLYEKDIQFETRRIELNRVGEENMSIPQLSQIEENIVGGSCILQSISEPYPQDSRLDFIVALEELVEEITFAVSLDCHRLVKQVRWPFHDAKMRQDFVKYVMHTNPQFKVWLEKYSAPEENRDSIDKIASLLDHAEKILSQEDRVGIWLSGIFFSSPDIRLVAVLMNLYQLGLDELWTGDTRPHLSIYFHQAQNRESVILATQWKSNQSLVTVCSHPEDQETKGAQYACYAAVGLAGLYIAKKAFRF